MHIHGVTVVVPNYDDAIAFYVGTLGFDLIEDTVQTATKRWVLVAPKGARTHLLLARAVGPEQTAAIGNQTGGRVGFFLKTRDFDRDFERLLDAGVAFEEVPRSEPYGKIAVFRDPFGNRWDLLEDRDGP